MDDKPNPGFADEVLTPSAKDKTLRVTCSIISVLGWSAMLVQTCLAYYEVSSCNVYLPDIPFEC